MANVLKKAAGWSWVGAFYLLVLVAGLALVSGGTLLATFALGVLRSDATWHLFSGIALLVAGGAVFVGGVVLLLRITHISVPGRRLDADTEARPTDYYGVPYPGAGIPTNHVHHHGGHSGYHDGSQGN